MTLFFSAFFLHAAMADDAADALAQQAARACGNPYALQTLAFTFIVSQDDEDVVSRRHVWRPRDGVLTVTVGEDVVEVPLTNGRPALGGRAIETAWAQFTNDSYWLIAPCKLMDPGTNRSLDEKGRLKLSFEDDVGLTPGDVYRFEINAETGAVEGWSFTLQTGRAGSFTWAAPQAFGPLSLSTRKSSREGAFVIRFEDVAVTP
ncbi:MAG: hypothetical protein AAFV53_11835 [Myxococcota bacterium]